MRHIHQWTDGWLARNVTNEIIRECRCGERKREKMMQVYEDECPCWHEIYNREISSYRRVTDNSCSHCEGSGRAKFVRFYNPMSVVNG